MVRFTRREFLVTAASALGAAAFPLTSSWASPVPPVKPRPTAKYTRHNVASPEGQKMLASYAKGVEAMLKLPADHPQNWFRNAFVHLMDCPHGNWWFYAWHRGYVGYFEQTIRALSGNDQFAMPYWDWTQHPEIPSGMFDGVLSPTDHAYEPYTGNLAVFSSFIKPTLSGYWDRLSPAQRTQLDARGYPTFDDLWNDVTGYSVAVKAGISGNESFATTCAARYLSRSNPKLDPKTTYDVSPFVVLSGLAPIDFYNDETLQSFSSSKTPSHNTPPSGATKFCIIEGFPHNKVHNCIGGVGPLDPGPYGNMTNFLSPIDPIFFLHHANIDRLWDLWTRKQKHWNLPYLPTGKDLEDLANEPFLFYVDGKGNPVGPSKAGDYFNTEAFDYDYTPGFGEAMLQLRGPLLKAAQVEPLRGTVSANAGSVSVPSDLIQSHLANMQQKPLVAEVTLPRPDGVATAREFDVLVNAPEGVTQVSADSPYYAGTIAFFGPIMAGMKMSTETTFAIPLPKTLRAFSGLGAAKATTLNIRVVPSGGQGGTAPTLQAISIKAL
ncbi:tyrosinase family protein [Dyella silvatica]|uniref:tyrosinase family protein n=1 Tax=Dyella silvatica TaxID=2992128 RepID=UPI00224D9524|nr:tyrosinase family protein [Dyella silvatica]